MILYFVHMTRSKGMDLNEKLKSIPGNLSEYIQVSQQEYLSRNDNRTKISIS
jgi:hypothetical protein